MKFHIMPSAHVKCYFNTQLLQAIAELTMEERNDPNIITLLPMGLVHIGGGRYQVSTKEGAYERATQYSQLMYHGTHRVKEAMKQDVVAEMLAHKVA